MCWPSPQFIKVRRRPPSRWCSTGWNHTQVQVGGSHDENCRDDRPRMFVFGGGGKRHTSEHRAARFRSRARPAVAFVLDVGRIHVEQAELQGAADAMVLATADLLPNEAAIETVAEQYAVETDGTRAILDPSDVVMATGTVQRRRSRPAAPIRTQSRSRLGAPFRTATPSTRSRQDLRFDTIDVSATSIAARGIVDADVVILQDVTVSFLEEIRSAIDADKTMSTCSPTRTQTASRSASCRSRGRRGSSPLLPLDTGADQVTDELDHMHQCTSSGRRWGSCYGTDIAIGIDRAHTPSGPTNNPCSTADISSNESLARNAGFRVTTTHPDALGQILASAIDNLPVRLVADDPRPAPPRAR